MLAHSVGESKDNTYLRVDTILCVYYCRNEEKSILDLLMSMDGDGPREMNVMMVLLLS